MTVYGLPNLEHLDLPDDAWRQAAACRTMNPNLFYPQPGDSLRAAKAVCAGCPVRAECLEYALDVPERHGIWGGLSQQELRRLRKGDRRPRRSEAECGTPAGYRAHLRAGQPTCEACRHAHAGSRNLEGHRTRYWARRENGWCPGCANGEHRRCPAHDCTCPHQAERTA